MVGRSTGVCCGAVLGATIMVSLLVTAARAYSPEQEQMCSNDAFRLCSSDIPDVDRITACMIRQRDQLSPGCKAFFREPDPVPQPVRVEPLKNTVSALR